jgi:hypothetical protein
MQVSNSSIYQNFLSTDLKRSCSEKDSVEAEAEETLLIQRALGSSSQTLFH